MDGGAGLGFWVYCDRSYYSFLAWFLKSRAAVRDLCYGSSERTVTDFGSTVSVSLPSFTVAETGFGTTVLGAANVFTLSTAGAVSVSPFADLTVIPEIAASRSSGFSGSRFVISTQSLPDESLAARASRRG